MYNDGKGVPQDYLKAEHWFRQAADNGSISAKVEVGEATDLDDVDLDRS